MKLKTCIIIGAGEFSRIHPSFVADYVIGADACPVPVDLLIGDFDTLKNIPDDIEIIQFPKEKDASDLELAVEEAISRGFDCFYIYGALGGRLDHTLASIAVLTSISRKGLTGWLISENEVVTAVTNGQLIINHVPLNKGYALDTPPQYLSIFPIGGKARGVTLTGLKYETDNAVLSCDNSLGLSNEFVSKEAIIDVKNGTLIVVMT